MIAEPIQAMSKKIDVRGSIDLVEDGAAIWASNALGPVLGKIQRLATHEEIYFQDSRMSPTCLIQVELNPMNVGKTIFLTENQPIQWSSTQVNS